MIVVLVSLIHILFLVFIVFYAVAAFTGAPFVPTPSAVVTEMLDLADVKEGMNVLDLGSGDGRLVIAAASRGAQATGWEIHPLLALWSVIRIYRHGLSGNARIRWGDFRGADIVDIQVILLFGIRGKMPSIEKKLRKEMKKGSRVISYLFQFPNLKLLHKTSSGIYCYQI